MSSSGQKILRSTVLVMGLTVLAKATGLFRDIIVAWQFGTSSQMDAFLVAATIGSLMFVWLRGPVRVVFVPLFTEQLTTRGERVAWENASILINTSVIILLMFTAVGWLLAPYLVRLIVPGFSQETGILTVNLTRLMMLSLVFLGLTHLLASFYHSYQRFGWPGMTDTVDNLVVIPSIFLFAPLFGVYGLVVSAILGTVARVLVQAPILWRNRSYYRPRVDLKNPTLRRMVGLSLPLLVGTSADKLSQIIDRVFASLLPAGSLSALAYGHRLTYATFQLFVSSLATVLFPYFSRTAGLQDYQELGKTLFKSLRTLFWIVLPISIGMLLLHEPLVRLVYQRGAFDEESVRSTGQAVVFYAVGLSAYSLSYVLSHAFFSLQQTKAPILMGLAGLSVKILLSFMLVGPMAHAGLALAESVSFMVKAVLLLVFLPRKLRETDYWKVFRSFGVTAVITATMAAAVFFSLPFLQRVFQTGASFVGTSMGLVAAVALGAATYFICSVLLQRTELKDLYKLIRAGFNKDSHKGSGSELLARE